MEDPGVSVNFLGLLIIGAIVGWLVGRVMKDRSFGVVVNIIVGIIGAFLGFWLLGLHYNTISSLIFITVGVIVLFFIVSWIKKQTQTSAPVGMASLPVIYTIQAADAPQHTGKLQEILQNLNAENRIENFTILGAEVDLSSLTDSIKGEDLILVVLTHRLDSRREQIESDLKTLKASQPGARFGEIIVDNVPYENEFITFPADLRHIRDREDMDAVWSGIEQSLKELFPAKKSQSQR